MMFFMRRSPGFTLIEICMVLVLLGILAAVAVPKFFDLQDESRKKAAQAAIAEAQARINAVIGQKLLEGLSCADAVKAVNDDLKSPTGVIADQHGKYFGDYQLQFDDLSPAGLSQSVTVSYMGEPVAGGAQLGTLVAAQCSGPGNANGVSSNGVSSISGLLNVQSTSGKIIAPYQQANSVVNKDQDYAERYVEEEILPQMTDLGEIGYWRVVKGGDGETAAANLFVTNADIKNMTDPERVPFIQVRQTANGSVEYYVGMVGASRVSGSYSENKFGGLLIHDTAAATIWTTGIGQEYGGNGNAGYYVDQNLTQSTTRTAFTSYQEALRTYQQLVDAYNRGGSS